jgi:hypothetical protein
MSNAEIIMLGDEPIPASEVETQLDFYSRQGTLGQGGGMAIKEGTITLGRADIRRIKPDTKAPLKSVRQNIDRYLVILPFTLHPAEGNRKYKKVRFEVELALKDAIASELMPDRVSKEENIKDTYAIDGTVEYKGVSVTGKVSSEVSFTGLKPVIASYGAGQSNFGWEFTAQSDQGVALGSTRVAAILEVPPNQPVVAANIAYTLEVERWVMDMWKKISAKTGIYLVQFDFRNR